MDEQNQQLWQVVLAELELTLSKASFTTWLRNTFIIENSQGRIIIGVPNTFSQAWLKQKYHQIIYNILQTKVKERIREIDFRVQTYKNFQSELENLKKTIVKDGLAAAKEQISAPSREQGLNPRYVFETFVVGKANELAHAAALAVVEKPGLTYNPLFIYGGVGLGKTHLLQAIGNAILQRHQGKKILYVTCEKFTNDFISAISNSQADKFNNTYRSADVLLMDDIQFLTGKEGTQEAFFHT